MMVVGAAAVSGAARAATGFTVLNDPSAAGGYYPNGGTSAYNQYGSTVVGTYWDPNFAHAFVETAGVYSTIDPPGTVSSAYATGVYEDDIVGFYLDANVHVLGYSYQAGVYSPIDVPGANYTYPTSVFGSTVVGYDAVNNDTSSNGFVYAGGQYGVVDYPGAVSTHLEGVWGNTIVGYYFDGAHNHGFSYSGGVFTPITDPQATGGETFADGVYGDTIAGTFEENGVYYGFVERGGQFESITLPTPGVTAVEVSGVYGKTLIGEFDDGSGQHGFLLTVPEPSTWTMMLGGVFGLGALLRRNRRLRRAL